MSEDLMEYGPTTSVDDTVFALSPPQLSIFMHQSILGATSLYNIGGFLRICSRLDERRFMAALQQVFDNNDALRISLDFDSTPPRQKILSQTSPDIRLVDLSKHTDGAGTARDWMQNEMLSSFDLTEPPFFMFRLFRVAPDEHLCFMKYHHLIVDGWAVSLIVREIAKNYSRLVSCTAGEGGISRSYRAFIVDDALRVESPELVERRKAYWLNSYAGEQKLGTPCLRLARATEGVVQSRRHSCEVGVDLLLRLDSLARQLGCTIFHLLLSAVYDVTATHFGTDDLIVGVPLLNRRSPDSRTTVGLFTEMLPLRLIGEREGTFTELAHFVRKRLLSDHKHRLPITEIQRLYRLARPADVPYCDISLSYERHDYAAIFDGNPAEPVTLHNGFSLAMLSFAVRRYWDGRPAVMDVDYAIHAHDDAEVDLLCRRLLHRLWTLAESPDLPMNRVSIVPAYEREIIHKFASTSRSACRRASVVELFDEVAVRLPGKTAVVCAGKNLSYTDVLNQSLAVSASLRDLLGLRKDDLIAVLMSRGEHLIPSLLGTMRAGCAYLPMDTAWPVERIATIMRETGCAAVLTESAAAQKVRDHLCGIPLLDVSSLVPAAGESSWSRADYEALAYVILTSGSTGRSKGVMVSHAAVTNFLLAMRRTPGFSQTDVLFSVTTPGFDIFFLEAFLPLVTGGTVVLATAEQTLDPILLQHALDSNGVTVMQATPTLLRTLVEVGWVGAKNLRIFCGGEALSVPLAMALAERCCELWNLYGPTEATVWATVSRVDVQSEMSTVPIGRPIENMTAYVLNADMSHVPVGAVGTLFLGGIGVARGYLNDPERTAAFFVPNPYNAAERDFVLYRTGDLVRFRSDGQLDYFGRSDDQVKIRGCRIELSEIEAALLQQPHVENAATAVRPHPSGEDILVAYVTGEVDTEEIRRSLRRSLHPHAVPAIIMRLDSMPKTPNGKVDRRGLPMPAFQATADSGWIPTTPTENALLDLWCDVLRLAPPCTEDDFFAAGGDSLSAMRLASLIRSHLGVKVTIKDIFTHPRISALGKIVDDMACGENAPLRELLDRVPRNQDRHALSLSQLRVWFVDKLFGATAAYNIVAAFRIKGRVNPEVLELVFREVVQRHECLRTVFPEQEGVPAAQILDSAAHFERVDLRRAPTSSSSPRVADWLLEESRRPFDLVHGPVFRSALVHADESEDVLFVAMHHIVSDGWSIRLLQDEITTLYRDICDRGASSLPPLEFHYRDYAHWQKEWISTPDYRDQMNFWRRQLRQLPLLTELPTDRPRPSRQSFRGDVVRFELDESFVERLRSVGALSQATLFTVLYAALVAIVFFRTGLRDIVLGTPVANRRLPGTDRMVGLLMNMLVLRQRVDENMTLIELLSEARDTVLDATSNPDVPFERLVEELRPVRCLGFNPLFQIVVVLQSTQRMSLRLGPFELEPITIDPGFCKFDLLLDFQESERGLLCRIEYSRDLFEPGTVQQLASDYQTILNELADHAHSSMHDIRLRHFPIAPFGPVADIDDLETMMCACPGVRDAVVCSCSAEGEAVQLVGFLAASEHGPARAAAIRQHLEEVVPQHLLPKRYVYLDSLPRRMDGSVDRSVLPFLMEKPAIRTPGEASDHHRRLVEKAWQDLLGLATIEADRNFFDLGGSSLLACRVCAQISSQVGFRVPVVELFAHPTIASLSSRLTAMSSGLNHGNEGEG